MGTATEATSEVTLAEPRAVVLRHTDGRQAEWGYVGVQTGPRTWTYCTFWGRIGSRMQTLFDSTTNTGFNHLAYDLENKAYVKRDKGYANHYHGPATSEHLAHLWADFDPAMVDALKAGGVDPVFAHRAWASGLRTARSMVALKDGAPLEWALAFDENQ